LSLWTWQSFKLHHLSFKSMQFRFYRFFFSFFKDSKLKSSIFFFEKFMFYDVGFKFFPNMVEKNSKDELANYISQNRFYIKFPIIRTSQHTRVFSAVFVLPGLAIIFELYLCDFYIFSSPWSPWLDLWNQNMMNLMVNVFFC